MELWVEIYRIMPKILWLPPSEISHMEQAWKWKYGNKCPDNTALSGLCRAKPYNYIEKIHNTLYVSDIVRCISGKCVYCSDCEQYSGSRVDWNGWRRPLGCGINNNKLQWTGSNGGGFKFQEEIILVKSKKNENPLKTFFVTVSNAESLWYYAVSCHAS